MAFYPLVGALIGAGLAGLAWLLGQIGLAQAAPLLPAALVLAAWAALTGALHLDGWADCCDALFVPVSRERRLEIMKDPRLGGFGAAGLILLLLVKLAALQGIMAGPHALPALIAIPALARWAAVIAAKAYPRRGRAAWATTSAAGWATAAGDRHRPRRAGRRTSGVADRGRGRPGAAGMARLPRLGGLTGDVYGAIIELAEGRVGGGCSWQMLCKEARNGTGLADGQRARLFRRPVHIIRTGTTSTYLAHRNDCRSMQLARDGRIRAGAVRAAEELAALV